MVDTLVSLHPVCLVMQNQVVISAATAPNATRPIIGMRRIRTQYSPLQVPIPAWLARNAIPAVDTAVFHQVVRPAILRRPVIMDQIAPSATQLAIGTHHSRIPTLVEEAAPIIIAPHVPIATQAATIHPLIAVNAMTATTHMTK